MEDPESWRPVVGYEAFYEVSNRGRVRSLNRTDQRGRKLRGKILSLVGHPSGHLSVNLCVDGVQRKGKVHRLVLTAFSGPPPNGALEVLHGDGNPANNRIENLSWGTRSENLYDSVRHGTHSMSIKTHCPYGHPYDAANTHICANGRRHCRACSRIRARSYKRRMKDFQKGNV